MILDNRQKGDILMDVSETNWADLQTAADDRDAWKKRVKKIKDTDRATTKSSKTQPVTTTHQLQYQRFTFYPKKVGKKTTRVTQDTVNAFFTSAQ